MGGTGISLDDVRGNVMPARAFSLDVDRRDIAHWITLYIIRRRRAPTWEQLRDRYGMSRATAFRWRDWARDKKEQFDLYGFSHANPHQRSK